MVQEEGGGVNGIAWKALAVLVAVLAPIVGGYAGYYACSRWQESRPARGDFGVITEVPLALGTSTLVGFVVGAIAGFTSAGRLWPERYRSIATDEPKEREGNDGG